jgi:hypothetical protein
MPIPMTVKHSECKQQICFQVLLCMFYYSWKHKIWPQIILPPFFSYHSYTNDFAVIKTHYKDGCTLRLNKTEGGTGYISNKSVQRVLSSGI